MGSRRGDSELSPQLFSDLQGTAPTCGPFVPPVPGASCHNPCDDGLLQSSGELLFQLEAEEQAQGTFPGPAVTTWCECGQKSQNQREDAVGPRRGGSQATGRRRPPVSPGPGPGHRASRQQRLHSSKATRGCDLRRRQECLGDSALCCCPCSAVLSALLAHLCGPGSLAPPRHALQTLPGRWSGLSSAGTPACVPPIPSPRLPSALVASSVPSPLPTGQLTQRSLRLLQGHICCLTGLSLIRRTAHSSP